jgi:hypothetical protein
VANWQARGKMPEPVARLKMGTIWKESDIIAHYESGKLIGSRGGRPSNITGRMKMTDNDMEKEIGDVITSVIKRFDEELFALSETELIDGWYFRWDEGGSVAWNIYQFSDILESYKRSCRRWEEHHHGHMCVVERVRDKYLIPRIKAFEVELTGRIESQNLKNIGNTRKQV